MRRGDALALVTVFLVLTVIQLTQDAPVAITE